MRAEGAVASAPRGEELKQRRQCTAAATGRLLFDCGASVTVCNADAARPLHVRTDVPRQYESKRPASLQAAGILVVMGGIEPPTYGL